MVDDREEIESVLQAGERILLEHPELYDMSLDDVLIKLDDGTEQMLHNRWGVTAWMVVKSLKSLDIQMLVTQLSEIDSGILTYKYAIFRAKRNHSINFSQTCNKCRKGTLL